MPQNPNKWTRHRPLFERPAVPESDKKRWVVLPVLWSAAKRTAMVLGFVVFLSALFSFLVIGRAVEKSAPTLPREGVLFIQFEDGLFDLAPQGGLADAFGKPSLTTRQIIAAIERAKNDNRIKGIFARMEDGVFASANVSEVRTALQNFKESGKFAYIYFSSYGGLGGGLGRYYLASVFDEIWMQPMGVVSIPGLRAEVPYFREVLDKIGVLPQFFQRKEYKTAYESFEREEMSPQNRQMLQDLVDNTQQVLLSEIAQDREMTAEELNLLVDYGLFTAEEALKVGLITHDDYADNLLKKMNKAVTGKADLNTDHFVDIRDYVNFYGIGQEAEQQSFAMLGRKPKVALVYVSGAIVSSGEDMSVAAADRIAPAILDAMEDPAVKAIVLRIDSPGGSPVASESILRALHLAREEGIKVIVSMGSVAASGGYWVASAADQIFALPTTITGSIGVVGGKPSLQDMWGKVGVNWDTSVQWGENAGMFSFNTPFSESEAARFNTMLDYTYISFLERVAKGRNMSLGDVDRIAGGRVWSGRRAKAIGLVDQLGGLNEALDYAALTLNLESRRDVQVQVMPKPKTPMERLIAILEGEASARQVPEVSALLRVLEFLQPLTAQIERLTGTRDYMVYEPVELK